MKFAYDERSLLGSCKVVQNEIVALRNFVICHTQIVNIGHSKRLNNSNDHISLPLRTFLSLVIECYNKKNIVSGHVIALEYC